MAYLPKNSAIALISPIFCLMVGCSSAPKVSPPKPVSAPAAPATVDYTQNPQWLTAQKEKGEALEDATTLQNWSAGMARLTATHLKAAKAKNKHPNGMSDCDVVAKFVNEKKAEKLLEKYFDAFSIQTSLQPDMSASMQKIDLIIEDTKMNLNVASKNCRRAPK